MRKWLKQADGDDIKMVLSGCVAVMAFGFLRPRRRNAAGIAAPSSRPLTGNIEAAKSLPPLRYRLRSRREPC
jgi:hypothetical protein